MLRHGIPFQADTENGALVEVASNFSIVAWFATGGGVPRCVGISKLHLTGSDVIGALEGTHVSV